MIGLKYYLHAFSQKFASIVNSINGAHDIIKINMIIMLNFSKNILNKGFKQINQRL